MASSGDSSGAYKAIPSASTEGWVENRTFDEIAIGESAKMTREITKRDVDLFALVSGDLNPTHVDEDYAKDSMHQRLLAHSLLSGAMISAVLGTKLPGAGTVYESQDLKFKTPLHIGDKATVVVTVKEKDPVRKIIAMDCLCVDQDGREIMTGTARVFAPVEKVKRPPVEMAEVELLHHNRLRQLIQQAKQYPPLSTAIVHPCDAVSLEGMDQAAREGLIKPILIGPEDKIREAAQKAGVKISDYELIDVPHSVAAAQKSVELARDGKVGALMKGSLHTDEIMAAIVARNSGLRTGRRMSHVFVMDVPSYKWPLFITDMAINIAPTLMEKKDICQNALDLANAFGIENPKLAILAATETINYSMPATLDAAALCKMAQRKQITGGTLDGPLAFDNAISAEAAKIKGIVSPVAGQADILMTPNIESANMLAKQLTYLAAAEAAGIVLGAGVPVILTSRADSAQTRLASAALAVISMAGQRARLAAKVAG
ncbi:MAG: bifunctional enoyl-CoA hydratase/phosphate acetyltransferase [Bdellovibrionales bacterium]